MKGFHLPDLSGAVSSSRDSFGNPRALLSPLTQLSRRLLAPGRSPKHFTIRRVQHVHVSRFHVTRPFTFHPHPSTPVYHQRAKTVCMTEHFSDGLGKLPALSTNHLQGQKTL